MSKGAGVALCLDMPARAVKDVDGQVDELLILSVPKHFAFLFFFYQFFDQFQIYINNLENIAF